MTASSGAGIASFGAYIPITRLPLAALSGRAAKEGGPEKAVAYSDEDAVTLAVAAAVDCLRGFDRSQVDGVYFASTTYPLREKQGASVIAKALDLRRDVKTADFSGSLRSGTTALLAALDAVTAGSARHLLVIASDCRMGVPRGGLEAKLGDGAVAFLVCDRDAAVQLEASHSISEELQDLWRSDGDAFTHTWEDRFVIQEGFSPVVIDAVKGLFAKTGRSAADYQRVCSYSPDDKALGGILRPLGIPKDKLEDPLFGKLGNTGCSFALLLLASALERARPGERLLVASYGDGADVLSLVATEHLEKLEPRRGVSWHLKRRRALKSYDSFLRARGLQPTEWEAGTDPGLSATIRFRERDADISFLAGRCKSCGQLHLPEPRVCYRCHAKDRFETYRLSDKQGRVLSYTFDFFFPSAEPPTIMVMTEVEGCRVQVQLADATPEQVKLEMPVEYVFRKIHDAGGKPNYFWKASPITQERA
jgi:3-hydroxy-3-methylglutaryl CoA synthase